MSSSNSLPGSPSQNNNLKKLLADYQAHLLKHTKGTPFDATDTEVLHGALNFKIDPLAKSTSQISDVKLAIVQNLRKFLRENNMPAFIQYLGENESLLKRTKDWNLLTGLGAISTHGKALANKIHKELPNIEADLNYLLGCEIGCLKRYKAIVNDLIFNEEKSSEALKQARNMVRDTLLSLLPTLESKEDVDTKLTVMIDTINQIKNLAQQTVNKNQKTGFSSVFSSSPPEVNLIKELDAITAKLNKLTVQNSPSN